MAKRLRRLRCRVFGHGWTLWAPIVGFEEQESRVCARCYAQEVRINWAVIRR